jgi:hypothetical protein
MNDEKLLCAHPAQPLNKNAESVPSFSPWLRAQRATMGNNHNSEAANAEAARSAKTQLRKPSPTRKITNANSSQFCPLSLVKLY